MEALKEKSECLEILYEDFMKADPFLKVWYCLTKADKDLNFMSPGLSSCFILTQEIVIGLASPLHHQNYSCISPIPCILLVLHEGKL